MRKKMPLVVEAPKPSPWISMAEREPSILGETVLFYVMGRVMPGICICDPLTGRREFQAHDHPRNVLIYGSGHRTLAREDFTHWRPLPRFGE